MAEGGETQTAMMFDSHMHTPLCKHAYGDPEEYVQSGWRAGLAGIVFTCHSPMPDRFSHHVRMDPSEYETYVGMVERAADTAPEGFEVRLGLESDFFPGMEEWLTELHGRVPLHYVLGSVHWHIPEYRHAFWKGDIVEFQRTYFRHLADSAETGLFDSLAHPDLVKNAEPDFWNFERMRGEIEDALDRIAAAGTAMELNTSGVNKVYPEMNPGPEMLRMMCERGIPVVIGSDSHVPERVAADFETAFDVLEEAGYESVSVFRNRKREDLKIAEVRINRWETIGRRAEEAAEAAAPGH